MTTSTATPPPIIELSGIIREFAAGEQTIRVLHGIDLTIYQGEMVAIIGQSGSGKSTLMNILGCLDKATAGSYHIFGKSVKQFNADQLAKLRREHFGFIFQRYHLLGDLTAKDNIAVPAVYAGINSGTRQQRAKQLLADLGLADKVNNRPSQLSGGQQQRVSIARALMNGGDIILADEPTGALDSQSGKDVMQILQSLNQQGHTVIMVTHDPNIAAQAKRVIELKDGNIIADYYNSTTIDGGLLDNNLSNNNLDKHLNNQLDDQINTKSNSSISSTKNTINQTQGLELTTEDLVKLDKNGLKHLNNHTDTTVSKANTPPPTNNSIQPPQSTGITGQRGHIGAFFDRLLEAFKMSLLAMHAHKMRTLLTMLGIIIGIASVVSMVGLGKGSQEQILNSISSLGTNTITVIDGYRWGDPRRSYHDNNLTPEDAQAVGSQPYVLSVSPQLDSNANVRYRNIQESANINGVGQDYLKVMGEKLALGQSFDEQSIRKRSQDIIIDDNARKTFFANNDNPIGEVMLIGQVPARVIGVLAPNKDELRGRGDNPTIYMPYTTMMSRIQGSSHIQRFVALIDSDIPSSAAEKAIKELMTQRHGTDDFRTFNSDAIRQTIETTTNALTLLISSIAIISLVVGGIGVMNIMLVSVTERTNEIGVRMAVGARQSDIMQQFLIEAILVCILGGTLGVLLAFAIGEMINSLGSEDFKVIYSPTSIIAAFACSTFIGVVFGFLPARNAAKLDPVEALSRD